MKRNPAASVRQRLLDLSRAQARPFQEILQFYVMERFLYRLSRSEHVNRFVLKGALMLQAWEAPHSRPTMDIDMLGRTGNDPDLLVAQFREVLSVVTDGDDGLIFHADSLQTETITEDADYNGVRIRGWAELDGARTRLQLDIGFGDAVVPEPERLRYPVLLDFPAPEVLCYSRESSIAEKFQAMVSLGLLNSRMKDFYDIWLLARQFDFDLKTLVKAIETTFRTRETLVPNPPLFDSNFARDKQIQWRAFARKLGDNVPIEPEFANVLQVLEEFIGKALEFSADEAAAMRWKARGPWRQSKEGH